MNACGAIFMPSISKSFPVMLARTLVPAAAVVEIGEHRFRRDLPVNAVAAFGKPDIRLQVSSPGSEIRFGAAVIVPETHDVSAPIFADTRVENEFGRIRDILFAEDRIVFAAPDERKSHLIHLFFSLQLHLHIGCRLPQRGPPDAVEYTPGRPARPCRIKSKYSVISYQNNLETDLKNIFSVLNYKKPRKGKAVWTG